MLGVDEDSALLLLEEGFSLKARSNEGFIARELIRIFVALAHWTSSTGHEAFGQNFCWDFA